MGATSEIEDRTDLARLSAFSDGVFAIAITLLVLSLEPPNPATVPTGGVPEAVASEWPDFLSYVISFLVIGNFWVVHHHVLAHVERYDEGLLWINILFLLCVVFVPFPTHVLGDFGGPFPVVFYAATQTVNWIVLTWLWIYATRDHRLVRETLSRERIRYETTQLFVPAVVFAGSIAIAFASPNAAILSWFLLFVVYRWFDLLPGIDRPE